MELEEELKLEKCHEISVRRLKLEAWLFRGRNLELEKCQEFRGRKLELEEWLFRGRRLELGGWLSRGSSLELEEKRVKIRV